MSVKTRSEVAFEFFLSRNRLVFEKIEEAKERRPDYLVQIDDFELIFEIKELAEDENFKGMDGFFGTVGDHIRARIDSARKQIQYGAHRGIPSILLIYNSIDPLQMFGTADMDFEAAMYGEYTLFVCRETGKTSQLFNGNNQLLQERKNTSFSAVGRLYDRSGVSLTLFENVFAKIKVPFERLPSCFEVKRVQLSSEPPSCR